MRPSLARTSVAVVLSLSLGLLAACAGKGKTSGTQGSGGGTTATATSSTASSGCVQAAACPPGANECVPPTCDAGVCGTMNAPLGTPTQMQPAAGSCQKSQCDGAGNIVMVADDTNLPMPPSACIKGTCTNGVPGTGSVPDGTTCSQNGGIKCLAGTCVACTTTADCTGTAVCSSMHTCVPATCMDLMKDGMETGVDCGGGTCPTCGDGGGCGQPTDCASGSCVNNMCAPPACAPTCPDGNKCGAPGDCGSGVCTNGLCAPPVCAPTCTAGNKCGGNGDCASGSCVAGICTDTISCLALLTAHPSTPSGVYEIDPDGAGGLAPFDVYCDMTTSGGGWTLLPLTFNDSSFWSITHPGNSCITVDIQDNSGNYRQYFSSNTGTFSQTYMKFVPPIPVTSVRFVNFAYTNSGGQNSMDFVVNGVPGAANTSYEAWYFVNAALAPVGYAFSTQAACLTQGNGAGNYQYAGGPPADCSRDGLGPPIPNALFDISETVALSATVPNFDMALIEGCQSALTNPLTDGEQFHVATPPGAGNVWQNGIAVR